MNNTDQHTDDVVLRLVALRQWAGYATQREFAKASGMSQPEYNHYESGKRLLSLAAANKLRRRWNVTLDWLYHGDTRGMPADMVRAFSDERQFSIV